MAILGFFGAFWIGSRKMILRFEPDEPFEHPRMALKQLFFINKKCTLKGLQNHKTYKKGDVFGGQFNILTLSSFGTSGS